MNLLLEREPKQDVRLATRNKLSAGSLRTLSEASSSSVSRKGALLRIGSLPSGQPSWLKWAQQRLEAIRQLPPNWNGRQWERPNPTALYWASVVVALLGTQNEKPDKIKPSADGGVAVCFSRGTRYTDVECFNRGTIVTLLMDRVSGIRDVASIRADRRALGLELDRMARFLHG